MNVLLIGAGRMGLRHLRGLDELDGEVHVVDPRPEAEPDVQAAAQAAGLGGRVRFHRSLDEVPFAAVEAAILSETAQGRLERLERVAAEGIRNVLLEKPLEQSRQRFRGILRVAAAAGLDARCNHYRRSLSFYGVLRDEGGPFQIAVVGGAFGLGCNGVHWLDFAAHLTHSVAGHLVFGEVEETVIGSGRGPAFRDYGGRGLFEFAGSRLFLSSVAGSSAPVVLSIIQAHRHCIVDVAQDVAFVHERDPASSKPTYLYGQDYAVRRVADPEAVELPDLTRTWIAWLQGRGECRLPTLAESELGHELLFDLLETSGETHFAIT